MIIFNAFLKRSNTFLGYPENIIKITQFCNLIVNILVFNYLSYLHFFILGSNIFLPSPTCKKSLT